MTDLNQVQALKTEYDNQKEILKNDIKLLTEKYKELEKTKIKQNENGIYEMLIDGKKISFENKQESLNYINNLENNIKSQIKEYKNEIDFLRNILHKERIEQYSQTENIQPIITSSQTIENNILSQMDDPAFVNINE